MDGNRANQSINSMLVSGGMVGPTYVFVQSPGAG
jgi:hypothetical protein